MACTCSTFAKQWKNVWFGIYHLCAYKMLYLYLAISWFGRVYIDREKSHRKVLGRNNNEQKTKNRFQSPSDESNTEL